MNDDTISRRMTNTEAIETLRANYPDACFEQLREAVDAAIVALKAQNTSGDTISRQAALDSLDAICDRECEYPKKQRAVMCASCHLGSAFDAIDELPSAQQEWNNHTVACILAELFDDTCACNYNDIDEWLPEKCELLDSCPHPAGVACWEQYLTHRAERRTDG